MGRFIPQSEAHPQPVGFQGLHGDVGIPQAACPGHRHSEKRACMCTQIKLPWHASQSYLNSHRAWSSSSRGPHSLQTQKKNNETIKSLPYKVYSSSRMLIPKIISFSFWGAYTRMAPSKQALGLDCGHWSEAPEH